MKRFIWASILCFLFTACAVKKTSKQYPVIPAANTVRVDTGFFTLSKDVIIEEYSSRFHSEAQDFNSFLTSQFGFLLREVTDSGIIADGIRVRGPKIVISLEDDGKPDNESYHIKINHGDIRIYGRNAGVFYAFQTLKQILQSSNGLRIRCGEIHDSPRYSWRGMHLDVCRHFFGVNDVKKYIDLLALYKMNTFHWHLTDDQGWRIEIKQYPLLTQVGSMRKETLIGHPSDKAKYDGKPYGGFYTQDEIKDIVAYAAERHVNIVPEIEMPGHALAALAGYPQFSCNQKPLEVGTTWGVYDDVYCAGNDSTFQFLENILSEVCELFPGKYIHVGGDECPKTRWKTCPKCQARIKDEHLKDETELQSYFIRRIEKFLNAKGKQIIGWNEILEGGLAPNAAIMSWQGAQGGIVAAWQKHYVVMSPESPCYFDHYQSKDTLHDPIAFGGYNPLDSVYAYDPMPSVLTAEERKYILGAQGNVWSEYIPDFSHVEYMALPRMMALSEALWSGKKDYKDFIYRLKVQSKLLDNMKVNYSKHFLD